MTASNANNPTQMSEEDYLKQHLNDIESSKKSANNHHHTLGNNQNQKQQSNSRVTDLQYLVFVYLLI